MPLTASQQKVTGWLQIIAAWRNGSVVRRINEVTIRWARLGLEWVTIFRRVYQRVLVEPGRQAYFGHFRHKFALF